MPINVTPWPHSSIIKRAEQFELMVAHIKRTMESLLKHIDNDPGTGPLTARELLHFQYQLTRAKNFLTDPNGVGHGDLLDADTRAALVAYSVKPDGVTKSYASTADLNASIATSNTAFNNATTEMQNLITVSKGRGQLLDFDDVNHVEMDQMYSTADMAALRVAVVALLATLP